MGALWWVATAALAAATRLKTLASITDFSNIDFNNIVDESLLLNNPNFGVAKLPAVVHSWAANTTGGRRLFHTSPTGQPTTASNAVSVRTTMFAVGGTALNTGITFQLCWTCSASTTPPCMGTETTARYPPSHAGVASYAADTAHRYRRVAQGSCFSQSTAKFYYTSQPMPIGAVVTATGNTQGNHFTGFDEWRTLGDSSGETSLTFTMGSFETHLFANDLVWQTSGATAWTRTNAATPSSDTGPSAARDGAYYAYIEARCHPRHTNARDVARPLRIPAAGSIALYRTIVSRACLVPPLV
jgi:hypothetical protein